MSSFDDYDLDILPATALLHDVGIRVSEEEHGYQDGKKQELYGPPTAEKIDKVKEIVGNHHSPSRYDYVELEILKKADRIVNEVERV